MYVQFISWRACMCLCVSVCVYRVIVMAKIDRHYHAQYTRVYVQITNIAH